MSGQRSERKGKTFNTVGERRNCETVFSKSRPAAMREIGSIGHLNSSSDEDDEGPEEVTFVKAKEDAIRQMKEAVDVVKREKALLKQKRRERDELFKQQKKEKQLPADVLAEIAAAPPVRNKEVVEQATGKGAEVVEDTADTDESEEDQLNASRLVGNYKAVRLKGQGNANDSQKNAKDFIERRLYGPGKNRTTVNRFFSVASKTGKTKQAAVHFIDKSWAIEKKRKAEKFKKKWINRQTAAGN
ncbi:nucleolar protein 7-like [Protopterus annectens]|uniref:nucleolar protein 7-like n=1 Tax=Protopterus annectens TaxID=7888 RepID=UPI001CFB6F05|nr:nucleolar protein 7-like [Protopterus annectens]